MENRQLASECMYTKGAFGCIWYVQLYNTSGTWSYVEEERKTRWSNSFLRLPRSWSRLPLCCLDGRSLNQVDACSDCPKSTSSEMKCMLSQQLFLPLPEEKELQAHLKSGALSTLHVAFSREAGTLIFHWSMWGRSCIRPRCLMLFFSFSTSSSALMVILHAKYWIVFRSTWNFIHHPACKRTRTNLHSFFEIPMGLLCLGRIAVDQPVNHL